MSDKKNDVIYTTPLKKLVVFFESSRNKWRKRSADKQNRIDYLETKIRDLEKSRKNWKITAKKLQEELKKTVEFHSLLDNKVDIEDKKYSTKFADHLRFHSYSLQTISTGVQLLISALTSLRGAKKCFDIFSENHLEKSPCFLSIQNWLLKFGLYELKKDKPYRHDWIYIIDNSVSLARKKCFMILGVSIEDLKKNGYLLTHDRVVILKLAIIEKCYGELVDNNLEEISQRYGVPCQIISDYGSDIKNGIQLFCEKYPNTLFTIPKAFHF